MTDETIVVVNVQNNNNKNPYFTSPVIRADVFEGKKWCANFINRGQRIIWVLEGHTITHNPIIQVIQDNLKMQLIMIIIDFIWRG